MKLPALSLAIFSLAAIPTLPASVLVNADFDAGYTSGQTVNGQSGSSDVGLAGTFVSSFAPNVQVISATGGNDLTYNVVGGGTISSGSNVLQFTSPDGGANTIVARSLNGLMLGQTVFARVVVSALSASTNSLTSLNFYLNSPGGTFNTFRGTGLGQFGSDAGAGIGDEFTTNQVATSGSLNASANLMVASFNWNSTNSTYDSVSFWLNPAYADFSAPDATISTTNGSDYLYQIGISAANLSGDSTPTYNFDSFAVGTTWDDVVPAAVPEPATIGFLAAAGVFLMMKLRRRTQA